VHFELIHSALRIVLERTSKDIRKSSRKTMTQEGAYEVMTTWLEVVAERNQSLYRQVVQGGVL
jgi:hypothetical protein